MMTKKQAAVKEVTLAEAMSVLEQIIAKNKKALLALAKH